MRTLIQNTVSYIADGAEAHHSATTDSPGDAVAPGYSYPLTKNQQGLSQTRCDRRRVGILYADIAGYSRLTEQDEEGTHFLLIESMKIMKIHISANSGRIANTAGDAVLAEFKDADKALHCAINVQQAARHWNANLLPDHQVRFRIGVNFGDVITHQGDIFGKAVNLAARLEGLAVTGGICISNFARTNLASQSRSRFVSMGKCHVKNIIEPVQAFRIEIDAQQVIDVDRTSTVKVLAVVS